MNLEEACAIIRSTPSLAADCRIYMGTIHRPLRPLARHEALTLVKAWCVLYQDEPEKPGESMPRSDDERSVAKRLTYCLSPLGEWPDDGDAVSYGEPLMATPPDAG